MIPVKTRASTIGMSVSARARGQRRGGPSRVDGMGAASGVVADAVTPRSPRG